MSETNTSAKTMCFNTLVAEQTPEALADAVKLCKHLGYTDENIEDLLFLTEVTTGHKSDIDVSSVSSEIKVNCSYIQNKYCLNNACKVCHSNPEFNEMAEMRERNMLVHLINARTNCGFFTKNKSKTEKIKEKFVSYIMSATSDKGAPVYLPLGRDIYHLLVQEVTKSQKGVDQTKQIVKRETLYDNWRFLNSGYCDASGNNAIALGYIDYIYTTNPKDKDVGTFKELAEYFNPPAEKKKKSTETVKEEPNKSEEPEALNTLVADPHDFDDLSLIPGATFPEVPDEKEDKKTETSDNAQTENTNEQESITADSKPEEPAEVQETTPAAESIPVKEEQYEQAPPDDTESEFDYAEPDPEELYGPSGQAETISEPASEETAKEAVENNNGNQEVQTEEQHPQDEQAEPILKSVELEGDIEIPATEPEENANDSDRMIPSVKYAIFKDKEYATLDIQKVQSVISEMNRYTASATIDIIHFSEYQGTYAVMTAPKSRYAFSIQQFSSMKNLFTQEKFTIMTGNLSALYAVLRLNKLTVKANIVQPSDKDREKYLNILKSGDISFDKVKGFEKIDKVFSNYSKAYSHSFRPGTGDESCMKMSGGLPEIITKQFTDDENESLLLVTVTDKTIPEQGWKAIKYDVLASMEHNEVFSKHKSRIHFVDDEAQTFTFVVPRDKIRSLQTVLVILLPLILDRLDCGSGIDFKVRKAFKAQTTDQPTGAQQ